MVWSGLYTIGAPASVQIGGQASEVFLLMTDRGVAAMMSSSFKLGVTFVLPQDPWGWVLQLQPPI
jgi:hypothetical protein